MEVHGLTDENGSGFVIDDGDAVALKQVAVACGSVPVRLIGVPVEAGAEWTHLMMTDLVTPLP